MHVIYTCMYYKHIGSPSASGLLVFLPTHSTYFNSNSNSNSKNNRQSLPETPPLPIIPTSISEVHSPDIAKTARGIVLGIIAFTLICLYLIFICMTSRKTNFAHLSYETSSIRISCVAQVLLFSPK